MLIQYWFKHYSNKILCGNLNKIDKNFTNFKKVINKTK